MVCLIPPPPLQSAHLAFHINKYTRYPINDCVEIFFQLINVFVFAMLTHVIANRVLAYPIKSAFQKFLSVGTTRYIRAPFLNIGILAITELGFAERNKLARIHGVE